MASRESSSIVDEAERSTIIGAVVAEDTTEGVPTTDGASSKLPDLPSC